MYQIISKHTRPSVDVEFYSILGSDDESVAFLSHWEDTVKINGKLIFVDSQISEDQLTMTTIMLWDSQASYDEAMDDPIVINKWNLRREYNTANGIVLADRTTETI